MSLVLLASGRDMTPWKQALLREDPNIDVEIWPHVSSEERVQFAVCWNHPSHVLNQYPNLKAVSSLGAGADHILADVSLPEHVAICRVITSSLVHQMKEYVLNAILNYQRNTLEYVYQKQKSEWISLPHKLPENYAVGIMGLGALGKPTAVLLADMGYKVNGWANSPKSIEGVHTFSGRDDLSTFLQQTQILVCMLPLTTGTREILDLDTFKNLCHPGYLINVGRGEHLVEEDLIYALDMEWLDGACLDVFSEEPLPKRHPFWNRPNIMITPHVASITPPEEAAKQIVENYKRVLSGMELQNEIDRNSEY